MLSRTEKKSQVTKLSDNLSRSKASFLVNCIGLSVEKMTELRKDLKQNQGDIQVIRNTLSLLAMEGKPELKTAYEPLLEGPNAFILAFDDVPKVAKVIDNFSEDNEIFKIKKAVMDGVVLSGSEVKALAKLPSMEILKSQLLGLLSAPLKQFLSTVKEVPQGFVRVLSAEKGKRKASS